jgi:hypothetical protein
MRRLLAGSQASPDLAAWDGAVLAFLLVTGWLAS